MLDLDISQTGLQVVVFMNIQKHKFVLLTSKFCIRVESEKELLKVYPHNSLVEKEHLAARIT